MPTCWLAYTYHFRCSCGRFIKNNIFNVDGGMLTQFYLGSWYWRFIEKKFHANWDMLTQYPIGSSYGRFLWDTYFYCWWRHVNPISYLKFIWKVSFNINLFNADGDMPTQYRIWNSYGRFLWDNFLMPMETCQHNILLEVQMEDFYDTNFLMLMETCWCNKIIII